MAIQIQLRRGTASQWTTANTLLAQGEIGLETDTSKLKLGDGSTLWNSLSYFSAGSGVTAVTATSPVASSGGLTPVISLASGYGDTLNPYASKTANYVLGAPNGSAGVPTFRAIVAADIPTLNQNTTGTASNVTGTVAIANGGTGQTTQQAALTALSGTQTSSQYLRSNGTNTLLSAIQAADVPTLNQSTTGSAATLTTGRTIAITGDLAYTSPSFDGSANVTAVGTLATVNTNVGSFTNATLTVNGKGLITAASSGTAPVTDVTATSPVASTGGATPVISRPAATTSVSGYLTSTDWTTFNGKGSGTVTSVAALTLGTTGSDVGSTVANGTTTPVITLNVPTASATNRGALSAADWTTFNGKGSGTVTSVAATVPSFLSVTGSPITTSGTLAITLSGTALPIANGGTGATTLAGASIATYTGTETLTNKRIDPRVTSAASASSLTPDISASDVYAYTALAAGLTINAPTGTPLDGDKLIFRLLDNGTSRSLTWNATYTVIGVTLPTATTISKTTYVGCIYNANNTRWDVIAVTTQA